MKIIFKKVRWKNLLSTGNAFTEIDLTSHQTTLIIGENGAGKSTILDALCFGLFGKPFRKVNKPSIVNSVNKRDLRVEIEFVIGTKEYRIVRGMKPNVFEVHQDGRKLNESASIRDFQKYIEQNILKLNYRSFTQIVVLGRSAFVPFMQLSAAHRREIIEDLLDIRIFSFMNMLLKNRSAELKEDARQIAGEFEILKEKIRVQKEYLEKVEEDQQKKIESKRNEIDYALKSIKDLSDEVELLKEEKDGLSKKVGLQSGLVDNHRKMVSVDAKMGAKLNRIHKQVDFFKHSEECPTCMQNIDKEFRGKWVQDLEKNRKEIETARNELKEKMKLLSKKIDLVEQIRKKVGQIDGQINQKLGTSKSLNEQIQRLNREIEEDEEQEVDKSQIQNLKIQKLSVDKRKKEITKKQTLYGVAGRLLKDSGIKTQIIRQYIPIINQLINKYLAALDFFVNFELDENFNEVIKSRFRDEFHYANFSEGEKMRIDLALLFAWRSIAKLKNSVNTNLLVLDEVFDASLDTDGCDYFLKLLGQMQGDSNIFVISHKGDQLHDKFERIIEFEKTKNFSMMKG